MDREDEVLWDVQSGWYLLDEGGRKHCLEDVLDTPMVREIINGLPQKSLKAMRALLSRLAYDPSLVGAAMLKPLVLPDWVRHIRCSDVENLYRAGVDDEWPDWVDASEIEEVEDSY